MDADQLERVSDRLALYGISNSARVHIVATVLKLPEEVRRFVYNRCSFFALPEGIHGRVWPARAATRRTEESFEPTTEGAWMVLLDTPLPDGHERAAVAHEIAHAWLQHDRLSDIGQEVEREAANQAGRWGFEGPPTDPDYFMNL